MTILSWLIRKTDGLILTPRNSINGLMAGKNTLSYVE